MTRLLWDEPGERYFETGLDRAVLYRPLDNGVAWNGFTALEEDRSGDTAQPRYFDGVKYMDEQTNGDFAATIKALTYPDEFLEFEGYADLGNGIFADEQRPKMFGLCYRTLIGNDRDIEKHAYKLHLVYYLTATIDVVSHESQGSMSFPTELSWKVTATPVEAFGHRPMAHLIVDSREVSPIDLQILEDILYGENAAPRLPLPNEIAGILTGLRQVIVISKPKKELLPAHTKKGDLVFAQSNEVVYMINYESPKVRKVYVIQGSDISLIPASAVRGDIIYDETTGNLYKLGG